MEAASVSQPKERNIETSEQKEIKDRCLETTEQHSTIKEEVAATKKVAREQKTVLTVATEATSETAAGLQKGEMAKEASSTSSRASKKPSTVSKTNERAPATPKDHITSGDKAKKRGRRKNKPKVSQNAVKNDKKPQSPMMKRLTDFFPIRRSNRRCKSLIEVEEKRRLEESILSGKEDGLEVRTVSGKGRGVVATRDFKKGQFVVEYHGDLIDVGKAKELEHEYGKDSSIGCYMYYFEFKNKRYCVDATKESSRLGRLLNHSKSGNCCTKLVSIQDKPHLILVAERDVKEGEELLYDYGDRNRQVLESHPWLAS